MAGLTFPSESVQVIPNRMSCSSVRKSHLRKNNNNNKGEKRIYDDIWLSHDRIHHFVCLTGLATPFISVVKK